jgi:glycine hydroxymethyltransferase
MRAEATRTAAAATLSAPWAPSATRRRLSEVQDAVPAVGSEAEAALLDAAVRAESSRLAATLSLYAGANSGARDRAQAFGTRPSMGLPGSKHQRGQEHLEVVEILTARAVAASVGATWVDVRPPSATVANLAVYAALTAPGATLAVLPERAGAHLSQQAAGAPAIRGHVVVELPYDDDAYDVDLDALPRFLAEQRPALVVLGGSLQLFPHRLRDIADVVHAGGAALLYDASHTIGLIAGGAFQDPLAEGADAVTFSTYKSYGGPPGGVIATTDDAVAERVDSVIHPQLTTNYDASRLPELHAAARALLCDGAAYAGTCIAAARALAQRLTDLRVPVVAERRGFTASHHLALAAGSSAEAAAMVGRLAACRIAASEAVAPGAGGRGIAAVRLGTQELVQAGLGVTDMATVAELVAAGVTGAPPADVAAAVGAFLARHARAHPSMTTKEH